MFVYLYNLRVGSLKSIVCWTYRAQSVWVWDSQNISHGVELQNQSTPSSSSTSLHLLFRFWIKPGSYIFFNSHLYTQFHFNFSFSSAKKKKKTFWVVEKTKEQKRKDKTLLPFDLYGLLVLVSLKWNTAQANCALIQKEIKVEHADHLYAIKKRKRKKQTKIWLCSFFPFWVFSFVTKL